jgi:small subunit ribosomal protein S13
MARISGIDLPRNKRGEIGLTYIYGIGRKSAQRILTSAGINLDKKVQDWSDDELGAIRNIINADFKVEGALRSEVDKKPKTIAAHARVRRRRFLIRRRLPNNR